MALFTVHIQKFNLIKSQKTGSEILGITANTFKEAELKLYKHLFRNELAEINESTLDILEEISSFGDQFTDLVAAIKASPNTPIEPSEYGLSKLKSEHIQLFDKAKIIVHEKQGNIRSMFITGQRMEVSDPQQIGKFRHLKMKDQITHIN